MYILYIADSHYSLSYRSNSKLLIIKSKVLALSLVVFLSSILLLGIDSTAYTYAQGQHMPPKDVMQKLGYELIYADTDSVFIKKPNGIHRSV